MLGKRAAAATGAERLELVRRRARILEDRLDNPEAAAARCASWATRPSPTTS